MRSFASILAAASIMVGALAAPGSCKTGKSHKPGQGAPCLSDKTAQQVATNFKQSIANYSDALAISAFAADFHDYSDSVIELIDSGCSTGPIALGSATFDSRAAFMVGQAAQPPIPFEQLNIWHTCDTVIIRWRSSGPGQEPEQVTGVIVMETTYANSTFLIETVYSEFNSGAWLVNLGVFQPSNCTA